MDSHLWQSPHAELWPMPHTLDGQDGHRFVLFERNSVTGCICDDKHDHRPLCLHHPKKKPRPWISGDRPVCRTGRHGGPQLCLLHKRSEPFVSDITGQSARVARIPASIDQFKRLHTPWLTHILPVSCRRVASIYLSGVPFDTTKLIKL